LVCPFWIPSGWNLPRMARSRVLALIESKADAKAGARQTQIRSLLKMNALEEEGGASNTPMQRR
jgi:hypothetical protein